MYTSTITLFKKNYFGNKYNLVILGITSEYWDSFFAEKKCAILMQQTEIPLFASKFHRVTNSNLISAKSKFDR
jgi:hypothetical protein